MTVALPGSEGLFSHMQASLVRAMKSGRVHITKHNQAELLDWQWLADELQRRPTSIAEVVQKPAAFGGDCDAAKAGMGGDVAAQQFDVRHTTVATRNDNSSAVSWSLRSSTSRDDIAAYLLRLFSLHRRAFRYSTSIEHLAGDLNRMADDCSRLWNLTDSQLVAYFNKHYPQKRSWRLCHLRPEMNSALISALHRKRCSPELWHSALTTPSHPKADEYT